MTELVKAIESPYQRIIVEDMDNGFNGSVTVEGQTAVRALKMGYLYQSALRLVKGEPDPLTEPIFQYVRCLDLTRWYAPEANDVLYLGLGAGVAPSRMAHFAPDAKITAVELDPEIISLAKSHFGLAPSIDTHAEDALTWLTKGDHKFDVIVADMYFEDSLEKSVTTTDFVTSVKNRLTDDGVVSVNLIGPIEGPDGEQTRDVINLFKSQFSTMHLYPLDGSAIPDLANAGLNTVLFASNGELPPDFWKIDSLGGVDSDWRLRKILRARHQLEISNPDLTQ